MGIVCRRRRVFTDSQHNRFAVCGALQQSASEREWPSLVQLCFSPHLFADRYMSAALSADVAKRTTPLSRMRFITITIYVYTER